MGFRVFFSLHPEPPKPYPFQKVDGATPNSGHDKPIHWEWRSPSTFQMVQKTWILWWIWDHNHTKSSSWIRPIPGSFFQKKEKHTSIFSGTFLNLGTTPPIKQSNSPLKSFKGFIKGFMNPGKICVGMTKSVVPRYIETKSAWIQRTQQVKLE